MNAGLRSLLVFWIGGASAASTSGLLGNIKVTTATLIQPSDYTATLLQPSNYTAEEIK